MDRAVDVDQVQRHGDTRDAPRFGDELVGDEVRRDLIEDVEGFERERLGATQLTRREKPREVRAKHAVVGASGGGFGG